MCQGPVGAQEGRTRGGGTRGRGRDAHCLRCELNLLSVYGSSFTREKPRRRGEGGGAAARRRHPTFFHLCPGDPRGWFAALVPLMACVHCQWSLSLLH